MVYKAAMVWTYLFLTCGSMCWSRCGRCSQAQLDQHEDEDVDDKGFGYPDASECPWCEPQCSCVSFGLHRGGRTWRWGSDELLLVLVEGASCDAGLSLAETLLGLG